METLACATFVLKYLRRFEFIFLSIGSTTVNGQTSSHGHREEDEEHQKLEFANVRILSGGKVELLLVVVTSRSRSHGRRSVRGTGVAIRSAAIFEMVGRSVARIGWIVRVHLCFVGARREILFQKEDRMMKQTWFCESIETIEQSNF